MFLNTFSPTRSPNPEAGSWVVAPHQGRPFGTAQKRSWFRPPISKFGYCCGHFWCALQLLRQAQAQESPKRCARRPVVRGMPSHHALDPF